MLGLEPRRSDRFKARPPLPELRPPAGDHGRLDSRATAPRRVVMDGDLQHPPEVVPELIARWREGYDDRLRRHAGRATERLVQATRRPRLYACSGAADRRRRPRVPPATSGSSTAAPSTRSRRCASATATSAACSAGSASARSASRTTARRVSRAGASTRRAGCCGSRATGSRASRMCRCKLALRSASSIAAALDRVRHLSRSSRRLAGARRARLGVDRRRDVLPRRIPADRARRRRRVSSRASTTRSSRGRSTSSATCTVSSSTRSRASPQTSRNIDERVGDTGRTGRRAFDCARARRPSHVRLRPRTRRDELVERLESRTRRSASRARARPFSPTRSRCWTRAGRRSLPRRPRTSRA